LNEARFFLGHLREEAAKGASTHPVNFRYYLSALLSAARSVTFYLQNEAKARYDAWFPRWRDGLPPEDRELLVYMNEQRRLEVHELGPETIMKRRAIPAELVPGVQVIGPPRHFSEAEIEAQRKRGFPPSATGAWIMVPEWYFEVEGEPAQVIHLCERYVAILERFLREFPEETPPIK
jgi:hypothetical protein